MSDASKNRRTHKSFEWYTPIRYVNRARNVMGHISLDPASCAEANENVKAGRYFTADENGLERYWYGNVFCNPPWGKVDGTNRSRQQVWAEKMVEEYRSGRIDQGILLLNIDSVRFKCLENFPVCLTNHRIKFHGAGTSPVNHEAFFYMGPLVPSFANNFSDIGTVYLPYFQEARAL